MRASNFGACAKAHTAEKLGYKPLPPPDVLAAAFERGNEHEEACYLELTRQGWTVTSMYPGTRLDEGQIYVELLGITGHLDGMICDPDDAGPWRIWEAKAPGAWEQYERAIRTGTDTPLTLKYKWQSSIYMLALGLEQMVSCYDGDRVRSFIIEMPPYTAAQVAERLQMLDGLTELPQVCEEGCQDDWGCPYRYLHEGREISEDEEIDQLVWNYDTARDAASVADAQVKKQRGLLEKALGERTKVETAQSIVTKYEQANPQRWDIDKIATALGLTPTTMGEYALPVTKSSRLKVTRKATTP